MTQHGQAQEATEDHKHAPLTSRPYQYFHDDSYPSQDQNVGDQNFRWYYDEASKSVPATPRKPASRSQDTPAPTTPNNFKISMEIPLEFAQSSQISWTMTPFNTPTRTRDDPHTQERSPVRPRRISTLCFDSLPSDQRSSRSDIDGVIQVDTSDVAPATPPPKQPGQRRSRTLSSPPITPSKSRAVSPSPRQASGQAGASHRVAGTFMQNIELPIFDNEIPEFNSSWATPVYPIQPNQPACEELPNIPVEPKRYYTITKGLRLGVFYDEWKNVKPLCKDLKGGKGLCRRFNTLRFAIIEYEQAKDKVLIPHIGHF